MSTSLYGWVEVNTIQQSQESLWFSVIDLHILLSQNYEIYSALFGVRSKSEIVPVAKNRGLPEDSCSTIKDALLREGMVNHTWISYLEYRENMAEVKMDDYDWGWTLVCKAMEGMSKHYGETNIRLVVAFDNYG